MAGTKLTPDLVDKLLSKLGSDDAFRAQFQKNADAAMKQLGAPADFKCGACLTSGTLASKERIQQTRDAIRKVLLAQSTHEIFGLDGSVSA